MTYLDSAKLLDGVTDPGGWQIKNEYDGRFTVITNVDGEIVDGTTHHTYDFIAICEDEFGESSPDAFANVRLIASAPRLAREHAALVAEREMLREALADLLAASQPQQKQGPVIYIAEAQEKARAALNQGAQS